MKILKPGKVEQRKFTCPKCGCEFAADSNDVNTIREGYNEWSNICLCPTCGENIEWEDGEPYEEPVQDIKGRVAQLLAEAMFSSNNLGKQADYLIANGVTFREG